MIKLWDRTSVVYQIFRNRFPFNQILEAENRNLQILFHALDNTPEIVLDIGTGHGNALLEFHRYLLAIKTTSLPRQTVALDFSFKMLKNIRIDLPFDPVRANGLGLPIKSASVSLVLMIGVMEYIENSEIMFSEIRRILTPGGSLIVSISPGNCFFYLRKLWAKRLFMIQQTAFEGHLNKTGFQIKQKLNSLTQIQFLAILKA